MPRNPQAINPLKQQLTLAAAAFWVRTGPNRENSFDDDVQPQKKIKQDLPKKSGKHINVVIKETIEKIGSDTFTKTMPVNDISPGEERVLGCAGSGSTTTGFQSNSFAIVSAEYVE